MRQSSSKIAGQPQRGLNVLGLRAFVAARQQHHQHIAELLEIHAIARAMVDAQLRNSLADRRYVARVAQRQAFDSRLDASTTLNVTQAIKPMHEGFCFSYLKHD